MWLCRMRSEARHGMLSQGETKQIEDALGVDALVPMVDFERTLTEVAEHVRLHGRNPKSHADSPHESRLGRWLTNLRICFNDGSLSEAHSDRLFLVFHLAFLLSFRFAVTHSDRLDAVFGLEWRPEFKNDAVCPLSSQ